MAQVQEGALTKCLLEANHHDGEIRKAAGNKLEEFERTQYPQFLVEMSKELATPQKPLPARQLAGIMIKNSLTAKNPNDKRMKYETWMKLDVNVKNTVKQASLQTLGDQNEKIRSIAAEIVARVALIELPAKQWPELIDKILLQNMGQGKPELKQASLQAIGSICEEIPPDTLPSETKDNILNAAVVQGMRDSVPIVKEAACIALSGALEFSRKNFEKDKERKYIMDTILHCARLQESQELLGVKLAAFELLVKITTLYYEFLTPHINDIFQLTLQSIKSPEDEIALQSIEFWSSLCDEEVFILEEAEEAQQLHLPPPRECKFFIKGALKFLIPYLTEALTKQEEDQDPNDWNVSMAAGTCLNLIANTVENEVVPFVMPFIERHLKSENWRFREAATLAFGSILEGPRSDFIKNLIKQAVPILLQKHLQDQVLAVKDTTAWTLGRIALLHPDAIPNMKDMVVAVGESLSREPRIASHCCWCIHNLAMAFRDREEWPLTPFFTEIVKVLLGTADRPDADEAGLRTSAFEALNAILTEAPDSVLGQIETLVQPLCQKMQKTFEMQIVNIDDKSRQSEIQGLICSTLHVITQRLGPAIRKFADPIMTLYLRLFEMRSEANVHEEAFMAIGAMANVVGSDFHKYMDAFRTPIFNGVKNWEAYQVCSVAVGVIGDIARALNEKLEAYCDDIVTILLEALHRQELDRSVKPPILSCFGDIALAIEGKFERYLNVVMTMLEQASITSIRVKLDEQEDYDLIEYMNQLREGVLDAYVGIVQGLKDSKPQLLHRYLEHILRMIAHIYQDKRSHSDGILRGIVGLLGDLGSLLHGDQAKQALRQDFVRIILEEVSNKGGAQAKELAGWAKSTIYS